METHNICFIGQTGFGKSSLINELFGTHFRTDPLVSCTKELYTVSVLEPDEDSQRFVTIYDTPGIGEFSNNSMYQEYYNHAISQADHIVLVVTLDRTDSTSQDLLESVKPYIKNAKVKFTIALNRIDSTGVGEKDTSYVSWNIEKNKPTDACRVRIGARIETIKTNYMDDIDFLPIDNIIPVCAIRKYGIAELKKLILNK